MAKKKFVLDNGIVEWDAEENEYIDAETALFIQNSLKKLLVGNHSKATEKGMYAPPVDPHLRLEIVRTAMEKARRNGEEFSAEEMISDARVIEGFVLGNG